MFTVKSTTEPQVKLAQGSKGKRPPSICITLILVIPLAASAGTVKEKLLRPTGGIPDQVPIDSLGSKIRF
jgi:hypothetical protein